MAAAVALFALFAASARAQSAHPFEPGEEIHLKVRYLAMNAGDVTVSVGQGQQDGIETWPLEMRARTRGFVDSMYSVQETFVSHFDPVGARCLGHDLDARLDGDPQQERVRYDHTTASVRRVRRDGIHDETRDVLPGAMDVLAAIYHLRSLPLDDTEIRIPVFTGRKSWDLVGRVIGHETVTTDAGTFDTIVVRARTHFDGKFASDRDLTVWLSNDAHRIPVRLEADFMLGTMKASLAEYHSGTLAQK